MKYQSQRFEMKDVCGRCKKKFQPNDVIWKFWGECFCEKCGTVERAGIIYTAEQPPLKTGLPPTLYWKNSIKDGWPKGEHGQKFLIVSQYYGFMFGSLMDGYILADCLLIKPDDNFRFAWLSLIDIPLPDWIEWEKIGNWPFEGRGKLKKKKIGA